jgi:hypothetical protein
MGLLTQPRPEWEKIRDENESVGECYMRHVLPLAALSPVAGILGTTLIGWRIATSAPVTLTAGSAIQIGIVYYLAILFSVFMIGVMIRWMGETYGAEQSLSRCVALAAYTATPLFLVGVMQLYPVLWVNFIVGLPALAYTVYLLYIGVPIMMEILPERGFLFASAVLAVGLVTLVGLLVSSVMLWSFGIGPSFAV